MYLSNNGGLNYNIHYTVYHFQPCLVPRCLSGNKGRQGVTLNHQSLKCHSRFALASMRKTKHLRRQILDLCMAILFILKASTCTQ